MSTYHSALEPGAMAAALAKPEQRPRWKRVVRVTAAVVALPAAAFPVIVSVIGTAIALTGDFEIGHTWSGVAQLLAFLVLACLPGALLLRVLTNHGTALGWRFKSLYLAVWWLPTLALCSPWVFMLGTLLLPSAIAATVLLYQRPPSD